MIKDVEYYNKDIIKIKQRNNKDYSKEEIDATSSLDLVACATPGLQEVPMAEALSLREGQEEAEPDFSQLEDQAPTSPPPLIESRHIKRAIIQYYQNTGSNQLQRHKLKIRLNCDFGLGEESVEFIAALTQDLGNFKKYHPEESRVWIQAWVDSSRRLIKKNLDVRAHLGKFHANAGWNAKQAQVNEIEPWTAAVLWYNRESRSYWCCVRIYAWEEAFELGTDSITDRQSRANVRAQKLWYNPEHLTLIRPKTWAEKRWGTKR